MAAAFFEINILAFAGNDNHRRWWRAFAFVWRAKTIGLGFDSGFERWLPGENRRSCRQKCYRLRFNQGDYWELWNVGPARNSVSQALCKTRALLVCDRRRQ